MARTRTREVVTGAMLLALIVHTSGHVYMASPVARQVLDPEEYNKASYDGRNKPGSICGDGGHSDTSQFGQRARFGIPKQNYLKAGQSLQIKTMVMDGHQGRFEFYLCQYTGDETNATLNQACFNKHPLQPVAGQEMVTYPYPYYWLGTIAHGQVSMWYYVPQDVLCDGITTFCVLQFNYWSGDKCNPPGYCPVNIPKTQCRDKTRQCGPKSELHRNCADVVITGGWAGGPRPVDRSPPPREVRTFRTPPAPIVRRPPQTPGDACCRGQPDGLNRDPLNCRLICSCSSGKMVKRLACREGFGFDPSRRTCRRSAVFAC